MLMGRVSLWMLWGCSAAASPPPGCALLLLQTLPGTHIHAWASLTPQGMSLSPNLDFFYLFEFSLLAVSFPWVLKASWAGWAAKEL